MKVYFAGAIRGGREKVKSYYIMAKKIEELGHDILDKHVCDPEFSIKKEILPNDVYKRDINWIKESDIIFADVTIPSLGVGYELAFAEALGKKIIIVYENKTNLSSIIKGNKNFDIYSYDNIKEVINIIENTMNNSI